MNAQSPNALGSEEINRLFAEAERVMDHAVTLLEAGDDADLSGLDEIVAVLCAAVTEHPGEDAAKHRDGLQKLMDRLGFVSELLRKQHDEIRQQIDALNHQRQAAKAYMVANSLQAPKPDEDGQ